MILTIPFISIYLVLLSGAVGLFLMLWWQKRPQPQQALAHSQTYK